LPIEGFRQLKTTGPSEQVRAIRKPQIKKKIETPSIVTIGRYPNCHISGFQLVSRERVDHQKIKRSCVAVVIEVLEAILDLRSYRRCAILHGYKDKRIVIFILIICMERNVGTD
jgi:hypothetical protein